MRIKTLTMITLKLIMLTMITLKLISLTMIVDISDHDTLRWGEAPSEHVGLLPSEQVRRWAELLFKKQAKPRPKRTTNFILTISLIQCYWYIYCICFVFVEAPRLCWSTHFVHFPENPVCSSTGHETTCVFVNFNWDQLVLNRFN